MTLRAMEDLDITCPKSYRCKYSDAIMLPSDPSGLNELRRVKRRRHNGGSYPMGGIWGLRAFDAAQRQGREFAERLRTDPELRKRLVDVCVTPSN
jgi:hypothetical protein